MQIILKSISEDKKTVEVDLVVGKDAKTKEVRSYTFENLEKFDFRDIRKRIETDLKSKGTITNKIKELKDLKEKRNVNVSKQ